MAVPAEIQAGRASERRARGTRATRDSRSGMALVSPTVIVSSSPSVRTSSEYWVSMRYMPRMPAVRSMPVRSA